MTFFVSQAQSGLGRCYSMNVFGLNPTEDDDEVNTYGDASPAMMKAAGGLLVYNPLIISRHTAQIAFLKTEIEGKDEEIERLKKETRALRKENEELIKGQLKVALHSKNKKIRALENKIDKLESDKVALQKKLTSLEVSLQCRRILRRRNLVRVRSIIVVAAIFDFMAVEDWGE